MTNNRYNGAYKLVLVESFKPENTSGKHGVVHIRPVAGQVFPQSLFVSCSRKMTDHSKYKIGTKFKVLAKLTDRKDGGEYLYSNPRDIVVPVTENEAKAFFSKLPIGEV